MRTNRKSFPSVHGLAQMIHRKNPLAWPEWLIHSFPFLLFSRRRMTLPNMHPSVTTRRSSQRTRTKRKYRGKRIKLQQPRLPRPLLHQISPTAYSGRQHSIDCTDLDPWLTSTSESPPSNSRNLPNGEQDGLWRKCETLQEHP